MPLNGKYYGTKIEINFEDGEEKEVLKLWNSGDFTPSVREIEKHGYTQEQWDKNEEVDDSGEKEPIRRGFITDHFESKLTYERALKLIQAINSF